VDYDLILDAIKTTMPIMSIITIIIEKWHLTSIVIFSRNYAGIWIGNTSSLVPCIAFAILCRSLAKMEHALNWS